MDSFAKLFIVAGITLTLIGFLFLLFSKAGITLFRLPGDIVYKKENFTFYFPITTGIIISIMLSVIFWLFKK